MAKKSAKKAPAKKTASRRKRRTPEEIIADLQAQIRDVRTRAVAKEMKQSDAVKKAIAAVRALDKGMDHAKEEGNSRLHHALADSRRVLGEFLTGEGLKLPKARMPRGRKPKA
ncbi:MAG: hypothetical protein P1V81_00540 [Planctomycetota bacterium]|nr:hypothetical protein [Planctomycetota bacterium]